MRNNLPLVNGCRSPTTTDQKQARPPQDNDLAWSELTGSPAVAAEAISRRRQVLDGGYLIQVEWVMVSHFLGSGTVYDLSSGSWRSTLAGLSQMLCSVLSVDSSVRI